MAHYLMALDAGIGGGRCVVFDTGGQIVSNHYREWTYERPAAYPGAVQFNADEFWDLFCEVIRAALADLPYGEIAAISATCMREGCVLLDHAGRELYAGPPMDERARLENDELAAGMGQRIFERTGHWPSSLYPAGRLMWFQRHQPELWERVGTFLMISDWILYRLSGERGTEPSALCASLLLDLHEQSWADFILERANIPREILPPIYRTGTVLGTVSHKAAEETGLPKGIPVILGGADAQFGLIGMGATRPGSVGAVAGTTTCVLQVLDRPAVDPGTRLWTRCHAVPGTWALEGNAGMTGIVFRWLRDLLPGRSGDTYAEMSEQAAGVPIGANGVAVIASSVLDAKRMDRVFAPVSIMGVDVMQPIHAGLDQIIRATMENICYAVRGNIELIEQAGGRKVTELRLCGGQARSPFWTQMQADVLNVPVLVSSAVEATALGAAVAAGVGVGIYPDMTTGGDAVARLTVVEPIPGRQADYEPYYQHWLRLYEMRKQLPDNLIYGPR